VLGNFLQSRSEVPLSRIRKPITRATGSRKFGHGVNG